MRRMIQVFKVKGIPVIDEDDLDKNVDIEDDVARSSIDSSYLHLHHESGDYFVAYITDIAPIGCDDIEEVTEEENPEVFEAVREIVKGNDDDRKSRLH